MLGLTACTVMAEHISGNKDLSYLKDQKVLPVEFHYPDPQVRLNKRESEYVREKAEEMNDENEGSGDLFKKEWHQNKREIYEPAFIQGMNQELEEDPLKVRHRSNVKEERPIIAKVKVTYLGPGKEPSLPMQVETHMLLKERQSNMVLTRLRYEASAFDSTTLVKSFHIKFKEGFKENGKRYGIYFDQKGTGLPDG